MTETLFDSATNQDRIQWLVRNITLLGGKIVSGEVAVGEGTPFGEPSFTYQQGSHWTSAKSDPAERPSETNIGIHLPEAGINHGLFTIYGESSQSVREGSILDFRLDNEHERIASGSYYVNLAMILERGEKGLEIGHPDGTGTDFRPVTVAFVSSAETAFQGLMVTAGVRAY